MLILLILLQPTKGLLQVDKIESNTGYTIIQEDEVLIPNTI